jgi:hypothetical protein
MKLSTSNVVLSVLVVIVIVGAVFIYRHMSGQSTLELPQIVEDTGDEFMEAEEVAMEEALAATEGFQGNMMNHQEGFVDPATENQGSDPAAVEPHPSANNNQLPSECYPKDVLTSADLLPRDANSLHAQVVPSGQGALTDQNFLTAGYHIGINTVGQSLRNANRQLRSEPPNPQVRVSPWNQTTIEPDINRRPMEIGGH